MKSGAGELTVRKSALPGKLQDVRKVLFEGSNPDTRAVVQCLEEQGYVVLRGLVPGEAMDAVCEMAERLLSRPSIAGSSGYIRADHQKKVLLPTLLGAPVYDLIANPHVIDIAESFLRSDCILAETNLKADTGVGYVHFPLHADFAAGWRKRADISSPVAQKEMAAPLGLGGAIYLHDTSEGAFCYCEGTHKLGAPHGQNLATYPADMRADIESTKVRIDGLKGDIVLFDDRGFHGPDHPSTKDRTLILVDYYRTDILGEEQVTPLPIWSCDIGKLSEKQLRVLGAHSTATVPFYEYKWNKITRTRLYPIIRKLVDNAFIVPHLRMKAKALLRK